MMKKQLFSYCIVCLEQPPGDPEHIIPESIGGRLRVPVLCNDCNHRFGSELVSSLKTDPSLRGAVEALRHELPNLYSRFAEKALFSGKAPDGSMILASKHQDRLKILPSRGARGSIIRDTEEMTDVIRTILSRADIPAQEIALTQVEFTGLDEDEMLALPTGHILVKTQSPPFKPHLGTNLASDRLWSLIALEYLSLVIGNHIYRETFDCVRQYISTGEPCERVTVQHLSAGSGYGPIHALLLSREKESIQVHIRLFRWLVYVVSFENIKYTGPDPVYFEDLKLLRRFIALTRSEAVQNKWFELK